MPVFLIAFSLTACADKPTREPGADAAVQDATLTDARADGALATDLGPIVPLDIGVAPDASGGPTGDITITVTGDDEWDGYLDGVFFGSGLGWNTEFPFAMRLAPGNHVFAFEVRDLGGQPTGLVADIVNGPNVITRTGIAGWKCSFVEQEDFAESSADTSSWRDAALCTSDPWGGQPTTLRGRGAEWVGCYDGTAAGVNPCATTRTRWYRLDFYVAPEDILY